MMPCPYYDSAIVSSCVYEQALMLDPLCKNRGHMVVNIVKDVSFGSLYDSLVAAGSDDCRIIIFR
jgi:hypothetical protein